MVGWNNKYDALARLPNLAREAGQICFFGGIRTGERRNQRPPCFRANPGVEMSCRRRRLRDCVVSMALICCHCEPAAGYSVRALAGGARALFLYISYPPRCYPYHRRNSLYLFPRKSSLAFCGRGSVTELGARPQVFLKSTGQPCSIYSLKKCKRREGAFIVGRRGVK